jgi:hypothetical protein
MDTMLIDYNSSIAFNAGIGTNLGNYLLKTEFDKDVSRLKKFEKLFEDTFSKNLDTNTVIERKNNGRFELFNSAFPKIKVPIKISQRGDRTLAQKLLSECNVAFARAEYVLFERYIASQSALGKSLDVIQKVGEEALDINRKPYFTDLIDTARRILQENPKSKLDEGDFSDMINIQLREIIETPEFQKMVAQTFSL